METSPQNRHQAFTQGKPSAVAGLNSAFDASAADLANPYFLHHSDNPGSILVSQALNGDNYSTWSRAMTMALSAKNKVAFIDGTLVQPDTSSPEFFAWKRCNDMILSWILNSISKELVQSVIYATTAAEVWNDLKERFTQSSTPRKYQIKCAIGRLSQNTLSVAAYYTQLKSYWDELSSYDALPTCSCGVLKEILEKQHEVQVIQFLMGLNDTFNTVRGQILLLDPLPSVTKVYSLILQEEKQREARMQPPSNDHINLSVSYDNRNFRNRSGKKPTYFCNHCNITGHSRERCFKLNGYPPNFREGRIKGDKVSKPNSGDQSKTAFIAATSNAQSNDSGKEPALAFTAEEFLQLKQILKDRSTPLTSFAGPDLQDNDWSG